MQYRACEALLAPHRGQVTADILMVTFDDALESYHWRIKLEDSFRHRYLPIISPDPESKPAISRPYYSTLIPTRIYKDQKRLDKSITHPSRKNKPRIPPRQKKH